MSQETTTIGLHLTFDHNFGKCRPMCKISSRTAS